MKVKKRNLMTIFAIIFKFDFFRLDMTQIRQTGIYMNLQLLV